MGFWSEEGSLLSRPKNTRPTQFLRQHFSRPTNKGPTRFLWGSTEIHFNNGKQSIRPYLTDPEIPFNSSQRHILKPPNLDPHRRSTWIRAARDPKLGGRLKSLLPMTFSLVASIYVFGASYIGTS